MITGAEGSEFVARNGLTRWKAGRKICVIGEKLEEKVNLALWWREDSDGR